MQQRKQKDISYIIRKAVEYNIMTGRYLQIAKIHVPDSVITEPFRFCLYIPDKGPFADWYHSSKNFSADLCNLLNISVVETEFENEEMFLSKNLVDTLFIKLYSRTKKTGISADRVEDVLLSINAKSHTANFSKVEIKDEIQEKEVAQTQEIVNKGNTVQNKVVNKDESDEDINALIDDFSKFASFS